MLLTEGSRPLGTRSGIQKKKHLILWRVERTGERRGAGKEARTMYKEAKKSVIGSTLPAQPWTRALAGLSHVSLTTNESHIIVATYIQENWGSDRLGQRPRV